MNEAVREQTPCVTSRLCGLDRTILSRTLGWNIYPTDTDGNEQIHERCRKDGINIGWITFENI